MKAFVLKYGKYLVSLGIVVALVGFSLGIASGVLNYQLQLSEKKLRETRPENFDKELEILFDKKIEASSYSTLGLIFVTLGFIFNNIVHTIMIRREI